nr:hypothetical protein [Phycobacter azelaicus]
MKPRSREKAAVCGKRGLIVGHIVHIPGGEQAFIDLLKPAQLKPFMPLVMSNQDQPSRQCVTITFNNLQKEVAGKHEHSGQVVALIVPPRCLQDVIYVGRSNGFGHRRVDKAM